MIKSKGMKKNIQLKKHMILAQDLFERCPQKYQKAIAEGRMLIIPYKSDCRKFVDRESAKERNQYVIDNSQKIVVGSITSNGMLHDLLKNTSKSFKVLFNQE